MLEEFLVQHCKRIITFDEYMNDRVLKNHTLE